MKLESPDNLDCFHCGAPCDPSEVVEYEHPKLKQSLSLQKWVCRMCGRDWAHPEDVKKVTRAIREYVDDDFVWVELLGEPEELTGIDPDGRNIVTDGD